MIREEAMIPRVNEVVETLRACGTLIIHAPSNTLDFYAGTPALERALSVPQVTPPISREHPDPPLPVDASDGGSDTNHGDETPDQRVWTRQHPDIPIDQSQDIIADDGQVIYSYMQYRGIEHLLIAGVHTNMCILHRSFGIKAMVRWGVDVALIRDLTDAMYNPARLPYVSHEAGTELVVGYIEKFWCPTVDSEDVFLGLD
jgi:nicotinamidase-related amidase